MKAISELEQMGYTFTLDGDSIHYAQHHSERPDPDQVRPLLGYLKQHRDEVIRFLRERAFEAEAETLLARCDGSPKWTRGWAELHDRWGILCHGFGSWAEWAEDVAQESNR